MGVKRKKPILTIVIICGALIYLSSGIYSVQSGQNALVLRFGRLVSTQTEPGINYHLPPPFERVLKLRVSQVQKVALVSEGAGGAEDVTGDENLIVVCAIINYDIKNPRDYLFNIQKPDELIASSAKMCLSEQLAYRTVDEVMTTGKALLRLTLKNRTQEVLDGISSGVRIISVELTEISPPANVAKAFREVSDAREKKQRIIKEAEGYANSLIPRSRGKADSLISSAQAYADEVEARANSDVQTFNALYVEYKRQPEIFAKTKYLETMAEIINRGKIIIDPDPAKSMYYFYADTTSVIDNPTIENRGGN